VESIDPLCQALHMSFLAGKRHFLPVRYCLHCRGQAAVSSNSWQESSKVLSTVQTHRPGVHPSRLQHGHVAPAEKAPRGSHSLSTTTHFNPAEQPVLRSGGLQSQHTMGISHSQHRLKIKPVRGSTINQRRWTEHK